MPSRYGVDLIAAPSDCRASTFGLEALPPHTAPPPSVSRAVPLRKLLHPAAQGRTMARGVVNKDQNFTQSKIATAMESWTTCAVMIKDR